MIKVVIDTNTLISALGWKEGIPAQILGLCLDKKIKMFLSLDILDEIEDVLSREKFSFLDREMKKEFIMLLKELAEIVTPEISIYAVKDDPDDNIILECAVSCNADYIISGDRHLLKMREYKGIKIISPAEFLEIIA